MDSEKHIDARDRKTWRAWLEKNHLKETRIALLVHKKHTGKPSMTHKESMEEAICFGWIDTTLKRIDHDTFIRRFARRTDKSNWSTNTLSYAKALVKESKMTPEGMRRYKEGLKKQPLDQGRVKNPSPPEDLITALKKDPATQHNFETLAPSYKRTYLYWLERAKRPETRAKRIASIITRMRTKEKPGTLKDV